MQAGFALLLCAGLIAPAIAWSRTMDEAIAQIAESLGRQIQNQQVSNLTTLQFTNISGGQTRREENLADGIARAVSARTSLAFVDRLRAEQMAR